MRPRCSILTGGFDFSGCGDCTSCPSVEHTEMSNSEPSAIVLQGIPCMCGLYKVSIRMQKTVRSRFAAIHTDEHAIWDTLRSRKPGFLRAMPSQFETSCPIWTIDTPPQRHKEESRVYGQKAQCPRIRIRNGS